MAPTPSSKVEVAATPIRALSARARSVSESAKRTSTWPRRLRSARQSLVGGRAFTSSDVLAPTLRARASALVAVSRLRRSTRTDPQTWKWRLPGSARNTACFDGVVSEAAKVIRTSCLGVRTRTVTGVVRRSERIPRVWTPRFLSALKTSLSSSLVPIPVTMAADSPSRASLSETSTPPPTMRHESSSARFDPAGSKSSDRRTYISRSTGPRTTT